MFMMVMIMTMCSSSHYTIHYQWEWDISTLDSSSSISRINFHEHVTEFSDWLLWRLLKVCVCVYVYVYIYTHADADVMTQSPLMQYHSTEFDLQVACCIVAELTLAFSLYVVRWTCSI